MFLVNENMNTIINMDYVRKIVLVNKFIDIQYDNGDFETLAEFDSDEEAQEEFDIIIRFLNEEEVGDDD